MVPYVDSCASTAGDIMRTLQRCSRETLATPIKQAASCSQTTAHVALCGSACLRGDNERRALECGIARVGGSGDGSSSETQIPECCYQLVDIFKGVIQRQRSWNSALQDRAASCTSPGY